MDSTQSVLEFLSSENTFKRFPIDFEFQFQLLDKFKDR